MTFIENFAVIIVNEWSIIYYLFSLLDLIISLNYLIHWIIFCYFNFLAVIVSKMGYIIYCRCFVGINIYDSIGQLHGLSFNAIFLYLLIAFLNGLIF